MGNGFEKIVENKSLKIDLKSIIISKYDVHLILTG
jgi:hypothetical protein